MMSNDNHNTSKDEGSSPDPSAYHVPVMLHEVIEGLAIKPDGVYVDCTFGGGGHSKEILSHLNEKGRLIAFDQDENAARNLSADDSRVIFLPHNFRHIQRFLRLHKYQEVDGILADLGVSSHQFDEAERGFSTRLDGELDMRMDNRQSFTAYQLISNYSEQRLHKLFEQYGEVTNAKTLARTIVNTRQLVSMKTIAGFKSAISGVVKGNPNKYFAQVFQALRIEVNDELGSLKEMLQQTPSVLKPKGRVVIISFHSLEDRIVKNFFRKGNVEDKIEENPFEITEEEHSFFKIITRKPIIPKDGELKQNPRARSAKLRVAEKI
jgi:16S rRNA (cytosine1402-N4)-methyltransferase